MDYEKKYNELVERVKEFHEAGNALTKAQMEIILPELREGEKEKTRIAIIQFFRDAARGNTMVVNSESFAEWADYLENEEEQRPLSTEETELNSIAFLEQMGYTCIPSGKEQKPTPDWMPKFLDELRSMKNYFDWDEHRDIEGHILAIIDWIAPNYFNEKKKGQKSIEDAAKEVTKDKESAEKFLKTAGIVDENGNLAEIYRSEQNPAEWSEEDEKMYKAIIIALSLNSAKGYLRSWGITPEDADNWLKSLRSTQKLNEEEIKKIRSEEYTKGFNDAAFGGKLKEWSEEDEDYLTAVKTAVYDYFDEGYAEELYTWLKSPRPQHKEEPLKTLQDIYNKGKEISKRIEMLEKKIGLY